MDVLPNELVDRVVDFLHDDPCALKASSLTCRTWTPAAMYHLLQNIEIRTTEQMLGLQNSGLPFSRVKRINICPGLEHAPAVFDLRCWSVFGNLTELRLTSFSALVEPDVQSLFSNFPSVEILTISNAEFYTMFGLMQAARSLPKLIDLSLDGVDWVVHNRAMDNEPLSTTWKLQNLHIQKVNFRELHRYFVRNDELDLQSLTISVNDREDIVNLGDLLHRCRNSLSKLDLRHIAWPWLASLSIKYLSNIREIELPTLKQGSSRRVWYPSLSLLATLDSYQVYRIGLSVQFDPWHPLETRFSWVRWDELDTLLAESRFDSLRIFEVTALSNTLIMTPELRDDVLNQITRLLPKSAGRNILKVQTKDIVQ